MKTDEAAAAPSKGKAGGDTALGRTGTLDESTASRGTVEEQ
jgi:hypothetical protein